MRCSPDAGRLLHGRGRPATGLCQPCRAYECRCRNVKGLAHTVTSSWLQVRGDIDAGHPSPLGLVTVHTADLRQLGKCHQVLAYGYRVDDAQTVTLNIYDPNTGLDAADDVWISFNAGAPAKVSPITHNINIDGSTLHGFFRSTYTPKAPPPEPAEGLD